MAKLLPKVASGVFKLVALEISLLYLLESLFVATRLSFEVLIKSVLFFAFLMFFVFFVLNSLFEYCFGDKCTPNLN